MVYDAVTEPIALLRQHHNYDMPFLQKSPGLVVKAEDASKLPSPFKGSEACAKDALDVLPDGLRLRNALTESRLAVTPSVLVEGSSGLWPTKSFDAGEVVFSEPGLHWWHGSRDICQSSSFVWDVVAQNGKGKTIARMKAPVPPRTAECNYECTTENNSEVSQLHQSSMKVNVNFGHLSHSVTVRICAGASVAIFTSYQRTMIL